ncbi:hypothetical protein GBA52_003661 [Prunus armeniaca]|nr:hypothetical protein GBA52_003661 [Prunus armeniaca]
MFIKLSRATLILTSSSDSNRKWLKPTVEVVDFTSHEPTSERRHAFAAARITPILVGYAHRIVSF